MPCSTNFSMTLENVFIPREHSQGALRFAPICLSVRLSVRPFITLYSIEFV